MIFKRHGIISWKLSALRLPSPEKEEKNVKASSDSPKTGASTASQQGTTQKKSKLEPALLTPALSNKRFQESDFSKGII